MSTPGHDADGTPDPTPRVETLREHLLRILDHSGDVMDGVLGNSATGEHLRVEALAALAILDAAKRGDHGAYPYSPGPIREFVYVHDPETTRTQASRASSLRGRHDGIPGTAWSDS